MLSSVSLAGGVLALHGDSGQSNAFYVQPASGNRVIGYADFDAQMAHISNLQQIVVYTGNQTDSVAVAPNVPMPVEVIAPDGSTTTVRPGNTASFGPYSGSAAAVNPPVPVDAQPTPAQPVVAPPVETPVVDSQPTDPTLAMVTPSVLTPSDPTPVDSTTPPAVDPVTSPVDVPSVVSPVTDTSVTSTPVTDTPATSDPTVTTSTPTDSPVTASTGTGTTDGTTPAVDGLISSVVDVRSAGGPTSMPVVTPNIILISPKPPTQPPVVPTGPVIPLQPIITITDGATLLPGESVHVEALDSSFGTGSALTSHIAWDFGDQGATYDTMVGFNAAHAYDNPGIYTVTLTITGTDGTTASTSQNVNVLPDNRRTIYVAADGSDRNDGLSPNSPVQSIDRVGQMISGNTRVLFRDGDTFDTSNTLYIQSNDVYIGSYGSGAQPIIMYTGPQGFNQVFYILPRSEGITIQGLTFDSIYTDFLDDDAIPFAIRAIGSNITVRDNTFLNVLEGVDMESAPTNVLVQNNTAPSLTGLRAYFTWVQGSDITIVGNTVANSTREHIVRVAGATRIEIANNNLSNVSGAAWGDPKDGVKGAITIQYGSYAYITNNTVPSGPVTIGPLTISSPGPQSSPTAIFDNCVVESNTISDAVLFQPGAHNTMVRNNVIFQSGGPAFYINAHESDYGRSVENLDIYNNTVTDSDIRGGFLKIVGGVAKNIAVNNNLFIAPNFYTGDDQAIIYVSDTSLQSFSQIQDNIWPIPHVYNYALGGYFYVSPQPGIQAGYLTPAAWEQLGLPTGDVYANITLASSNQVTMNSITVGSDLPTGN